MQLIDIPSPNLFRDIQVQINHQYRSFKSGFCKLKPNTDDTFTIIQNDAEAKVTFLSQNIVAEITYFLHGNSTYLVEITHITKDSLFIHLAFFQRGKPLILGEVDIGYDEVFVKQLKNTPVSKESLERQFPHSFEIIDPLSKEKWLLIFAGNNDELDINDENAFSICGHSHTVSVERREHQSKTIWFATKYASNHTRRSNLLLAKGTVKFTQADQATLATQQIQTWKKENEQEADFYMDTWDQYGDLEWEAFYKKVYTIGAVTILEAKKEQGSLQVRVSKADGEKFSKGDPLEPYDDNFPVNITDTEQIPWEEFYKHLKDYKKNTSPTFEVKDITDDNDTSIVTLSNENNATLSVDQQLQYSIAGTITQIKRRHQARTKIQQGQAGIPNLHLILNPGGEDYYTPAFRKQKRHQPLTPSVKDKIYGKKYDPMPRQVEAIDIALNTPDIAIIQGPPGTGKTTVIAAIVERLNQLEKKTNIAGTVLVSAYQQDAVDNLVARLTVNSLPSWKLGGRKKEDELRQYEKLLHWGRDVVDKVVQQNPIIENTLAETNLMKLWDTYCRFPCATFAIQFLEQVLDDKHLFAISREQSERIQKKIDAIAADEEKKKASFNSIRRHIYAIRTTSQGIKDDGRKRVLDLIQYVEDNPMFADDFQQWKEPLIAFVKSTSTTKKDRADLQNLKQTLLLHFRPKTQFSEELLDKELQKLTNDIFAGLKQNSTNSIQHILVNYLEDVETNMYEVIRILLEYNYVYATSVQQSVKDSVIKTKQAYQYTTEGHNYYDTVIIDEAARTAPRDLLIPMTLARKRIILVGDHRQLPHIVEQALLEQIEKQEEERPLEKKDVLSKSLFEHLFERCAALERMDGIPRRITLDAQFRTHPTLGNFVSSQFYPAEEQFASPLPVTHFEHGILNLHNKCAVWINTPYSQRHRERRSGTSWTRHIEITAIAEQLAKWLKDENYQSLSFGVISFYKAQTTAIKRELLESKYQLSQDGQSLDKKYRILENGHERLRIGTVDAFQGMEFDIVFLSTVRSFNVDQITISTPPRRVFGHINAPERLCVSMSRQKKLLIAVGDGTLMQSDFALEHCSHLAKFYQLCMNEPEGLVHNFQQGLL